MFKIETGGSIYFYTTTSSNIIIKQKVGIRVNIRFQLTTSKEKF